MNYREYEKACFNKLLYEFPEPEFIVTHNDREYGRFSECKRQIDVTVRRNLAKAEPVYLIIDAKKYKKKIGLSVVESIIGLMDDIRCQNGCIVSPCGYTKYADNRVKSSELSLLILNYDEAIEMNFRELAREVYPYDPIFHPKMGRAYKALSTGDITRFIDSLNGVFYEEWLALFQSSLDVPIFRENAIDALKAIAEYHYDDGWRYNAIQLLEDHGEMSNSLLSRLLEKEVDQKNLQLLNNISSYY